MLSKDLYAHKAEKYARYRWGYASQAVETLLKTTRLGKVSVVVDIGAGPGNLAKHLLDHAARVTLVEPDPCMHRVSETLLGRHERCHRGCVQRGKRLRPARNCQSPWKPIDFYFDGNDFQKLDFPFLVVNNRAEYIGALSTASYAPDEDHPLYEKFVAAASEVFERFNIDGKLHNLAAPEMYLGHLKA